jgi:dTDP-4-dehydrorhamnose 3,5-epimerase
MRLCETALPEVGIIEPDVHADTRGFFLETWNARRYRDLGLPDRFAQDSLSRSVGGTLRGLHLQHPYGQGKLVYVLEGEVFDVAVDVRTGSPRFGRWAGVVLSADNKRQVYVPPGFAHGFCVTSEVALFAYKCTEPYHPETEIGVLWSDPDIAIEWPATDFTLSARDAALPRLRDIAAGRLPGFDDHHFERSPRL